MNKLFLFITATLLFARINPFEPVVKPYNYEIIKPDYFKEKKVYFPNDARVLKKIIFVYQSVDGDIKQKEVVINKNIDFHKPITLIHKVVKFPTIKMHFLDLFDMYIKNRTIFISTKDRLVRHMFLVSPFRLVLDFSKDANFLTLTRNVKNSIVKKVVVGNHNGYYRVVIFFDAKYFYKIKKVAKGVKIELR
jgi:hypothetical protein